MRIAAIALTAVLAAGPAAAQAAADKADVRCLLVLKLAERDPNAREQASKGVHYYMGRLAARGPVARLEPIMAGEGRTIDTAAEAQTELQRCAGELNQNQAAFNAVGQKLSAGQRPPAAAPAKK